VTKSVTHPNNQEREMAKQFFTQYREGYLSVDDVANAVIKRHGASAELYASDRGDYASFGDLYAARCDFWRRVQAKIAELYER
jgi:hypothetical protein